MGARAGRERRRSGPSEHPPEANDARTPSPHLPASLLACRPPPLPATAARHRCRRSPRDVCYSRPGTMGTPFDDLADAELGDLASKGLLRSPDDGAGRRAAEAAAEALGVPFIDASSNDYLGLARDVSRETPVQAPWPGAGASRLIHGTRAPHLVLERALAEWVSLPEALLFSSGYAANVGLLQALGLDGAVVISDALNHASIVDGCRLSRARIEVVPHLDLGAVERALSGARGARARFVVVESCFSMDGDGPDLRRLRALCDRHAAALLVDEAHALGVFGPFGAGRCAAAQVRPDALVGTLGKAVGVHGAFVAGSRQLRELLWNRARSFVFSTAPSPHLAALAAFHVERARRDDAGRTRLHRSTAELRTALRVAGVPAMTDSDAPIVPVLIGSSERALAVSSELQHAGILVQAIRYPTVPDGTARLRLTVSASWADGAPDRVASTLARALEACP
jgi:8-amino-7-oxononanoate synthase